MGIRFAPTLAEIEHIARDAMARLPPPFDAWLDGVVLHVVDFPDEETLDLMGCETPFDLLGLYQGHPVGDPGGDATGALPASIFLYRRALLEEWAATEESLEALVTHVLIHEVGHHFGLSDEDMEAIEASTD